MTQPLDVSFFRPLKQAWRYCQTNWKNSNTRLNASLKSSFTPTLVCESLERIKNVGSISGNLKSGFQATGIHPIDRHVILQKLPTNENPNDINNIVIQYFKSQWFEKNDKNMKRKKFILGKM